MAVSTSELFEQWKKKLLDLSKRNSLINFKGTRRGVLQIVYPEYNKLFDGILDEKVFSFAKPDDVEEFESFDSQKKGKYKFSIKSSKEHIEEEQSVLALLRKKVRIVMEEQGINVLHLAFGQLKWAEKGKPNDIITSPLILVPVTLSRKSLLSPYKLELQDDDVTLNPTLNYKLNHDFNITLPDFCEDSEIDKFLTDCEKIIAAQPGWSIERNVYLSVFSYLKINMYNDLCNNESCVCSNSLVKALSGDKSALPDVNDVIQGVVNTDFDKDVNPQSVFQVLDADSSQREAIELAKKGVSFVLQGPPGTGKSQTIANIIAEFIANNKRVLFVSEKEAALDVVRNRLDQSGIMDFCLALHSHKANKKNIIKELYRAVNLEKKKIKGEYLVRLEELYENRNKLDEISREIHREKSLLNMSLYRVNGEFSKLDKCRDVIFECGNIDSITQKMFDRQCETIKLLSAKINSFKGNRFSKLWGDCKLPNLSQQNKTDFKARIDDAFISDIKEDADKIKQLFGEKYQVSLNDIAKMIDLLEFCAECPPIPQSWNKERLDEINSHASRLKNVKDEISDSQAVVSLNFNPEVSSVDAAGLKNAIDDLDSFITAKTLFAVESHCSNKYFPYIEELSKKISIVKDFISQIRSVEQKYDQLRLNLGEQSCGKVCSIFELFKSLECLSEVRESWFDKSAIESLRSLISETIDTLTAISKLREDVSLNFDDSIYGVDYKQLLPRFRTEYNSIFRFIRKSFWNDIKSIKACEKRGKLSYSDALGILNKIKDIREKEKSLENRLPDYECYFGLSEVPKISDTQHYKDVLVKFVSVNDFYFGNVPETTKCFILNKSFETKDFERTTENLKKICTDLYVLDIISSYCKKDDKEIFDRLVLDVIESERNVSCIKQGIASLRACSKTPLENLENIEHIANWCCYVNKLKEEQQHLEMLFQMLYEGPDTDWDSIIKKIEWCRNYYAFEDELSLPKMFFDSLRSDSKTVSLSKQAAKALKVLKKEKIDDLLWFGSWFSDDFRFLDLDIKKIINIAEHYQSNLEFLDDWLSINRVFKECSSIHLTSFVDKVVMNPEISCDEYLGIFKKRFFSIWIDTYLPMLPEISKMSKIEVEKLIDDFRKQDIAQFDYARQRIHQMLTEKHSDSVFTFCTDDELRILRHEYTKKKRLMSLRTLFSKIPNLIQSIKPCLMMSPLSVSMFLNYRNYKFDLIIFDEASQIKPENAIGAIIRGSQIIVAGDTHQLPPTSFFEKISDGEDLYDSDDDVDETYAYEESILDALTNVLPERYLKWHYRSRHEHLITFSNRKIYENRLTTFPSAIDKMPDVGVEFVYVQDGVYDRSGKRNNPEEARKVSELVINHLINHPDRSLGIIANSDSQAREIESRIDEVRKENLQYEEFFDESRTEPFFIKSIENVQGDERDTIIYSVGYGKDKTGKMYNSFGPINQDGGERRLNVAITRAKCNLKLVSSIMSDDISVGEASKQGPKLLKLYIDYANRGMQALTEVTSENELADFDSPFEESVYDFLTDMGYKVDIQVGCAGYKIDLAVKDPDDSGRYILAIECDGASYHSAQYARERDRLRQAVLENLGWRFYRVWSTEWVRHTRSEQNNLLAAIKDAVDNKNVVRIKSSEQSEKEKASIKEETSHETDELFRDEYKFEEYQKADSSVYMCEQLSEIIDKVLEAEAPMHKELLYRRVLPIIGREKVTKVVVSKVDDALEGLLGSKYELGKGLGGDGFIYKLPRQSEYKIREVADRDVKYICPEELCDLMKQVEVVTANHSVALVAETARALGCSRFDEDVAAVLKSIWVKQFANDFFDEAMSDFSEQKQ